ncbi:MAG: hypothetical protein JNK02_01055 [Planctomycetes bacterium]|nr:hypothetical protein [Planctomycetota bacterium]
MATIDRSQDSRSGDERPAGAGAARWTWMTSGALFAGALVTAIAPRVLPGTAPAAADLARHGLTWPLMLGFALVLAAIASAARRAPVEPVEDVSAPARGEPAQAPADEGLVREITSELARVRGALHDLRVDFVYLKDGIARLQQAATQTDSDSNRETEAAIFRLAASLDQLGGRIEHELAAQRSWLQDVLDQDRRLASSTGSLLARSADPYGQAYEGGDHEIEVEPGFQTSSDDLHVEVALDGDTSWPQGLGVLDQIDEPRPLLANGKTSPSGRPSPASGLFDPIEHGAAELEEKMSQLRHLLSDPAVQRALDARAR